MAVRNTEVTQPPVLTNRLSRLMGERRVTIQAVADGTGLSRKTLSDLYHDKSARLDLSTLNKLCEFFRVGPEQIFEWQPDPAPDGDGGEPKAA